MATRLFTLGLPRVEADAIELGSFQRHRLCCAVLTYVAVERAATRDRIIGVFWPDRAPDAARHALSQTLYEIRRAIPSDPFEVDGERIQAAQDLWVDVVALETAVADGCDDEACALYAGPFLDGAYLWRTSEWEQWVETQRARLLRLHRKARRRLLADLRAAGRLQEALAAARAWAELDALEDEAHHGLIDLLARTGRRADALRHFADYSARLQQELEVEPLEETRRLVDEVRAGRADDAATPVPRATEDAPDPGPVADGIEIVRALGTGSVATVYLARESALQRLIALKLLASDLADDRRARLRFQREAEAAARIHHPNVLPIFRVGQTGAGRPFMTMPYVQGGTLAARLEAWGPLDPDEAVHVGRQVTAGLVAAHRLGIVHRDVRADNVLFETESGRCLLCDFGLATVLEELSPTTPRLTRPGERIGDPSCISPEQLLGQPVSARTDVYGLGTLLFSLLTGRAPFDVDTPADLLRAHVREKPHRVDRFRPEAPAGIVDLVDRCLAKRPEHRPAPDDVLEALGG